MRPDPVKLTKKSLREAHTFVFESGRFDLLINESKQLEIRGDNDFVSLRAANPSRSGKQVAQAAIVGALVAMSERQRPILPSPSGVLPEGVARQRKEACDRLRAVFDDRISRVIEQKGHAGVLGLLLTPAFPPAPPPPLSAVAVAIGPSTQHADLLRAVKFVFDGPLTLAVRKLQAPASGLHVVGERRQDAKYLDGRAVATTPDRRRTEVATTFAAIVREMSVTSANRIAPGGNGPGSRSKALKRAIKDYIATKILVHGDNGLSEALRGGADGVEAMVGPIGYR